LAFALMRDVQPPQNQASTAVCLRGRSPRLLIPALLITATGRSFWLSIRRQAEFARVSIRPAVRNG
jgi:hypothetical protein